MAGLYPTVSTSPTTSAKSNGVGELASLESSPYDFSTTRYPLSVGTDDAPHYVVFNINLPDNSKYTQSAGGMVANVQTASQENYDLKSAQGGVLQASGTSATQAAAGGTVVGLVTPGSSIVGEAASGAAINVLGANLQIKPKLQRVKKAIALYMPDTVLFEYQHGWQESSVTGAMGKGGTYAALGGGLENIGKNLLGDAQRVGEQIAAVASGGNFDTSQLKPILYNNAQGAEAVGTVAQAFGAGSNFTELALRAVNRAINPQIEMVFQGTHNRGFIFVFDFQPRSSAESTDILDIINTFRTYAAPELSNEGNGRYFIPPGQFDISFYFKDTPSTQLPKISTCALVGIAVDYNRAGQYATFADGMPVHINMQLTFKEMTVITRELIEGFGY